MANTRDKLKGRIRRRKSIRKKVFGTAERPRLAVFRSSQHIYAQIIDDSRGVTLVAASSLASEIREGTFDNKTEVAKAVGLLLGQRAKALNVASVVFDRGGFLYHGRVAALADGSREAGLSF